MNMGPGAELQESLSLRAPLGSLGQHSAQTITPRGTGVLSFSARVRHTGEEGGGQCSSWCRGPQSLVFPIYSPGSSQPGACPPGEAEGALTS